MAGSGTKDDPWVLKTPPGTSDYTMYRDGDQIVCMVGSTKLTMRRVRSTTCTHGSSNRTTGCRSGRR